jgi:hypothetical protein
MQNQNPLLNWREKYGYQDTPQILGAQSPQQQAYWAMNKTGAQNQAAAVNRMPFVLNPADLSMDPAANKAMMFQQPQQAAPAQPQPQTGSDPMQAIMALIQQHPDIVPLLLQSLQSQGQQS